MVKQLRVEALLLALRFSWPFLAPAFIMAVVASTSKRMRRAAFDAWVEDAIQAALPAAPDVTRSALVCLHGIMDSWHASMLYIAFSMRATTTDKKMALATARTLRDVIARCIIREHAALCKIQGGKESLFKERVRTIFGSHLEHLEQEQTLFSQMINAFHKNVRGLNVSGNNREIVPSPTRVDLRRAIALHGLPGHCTACPAKVSSSGRSTHECEWTD